jgi:PIN domain nuclease of toxin-antitoxin system
VVFDSATLLIFLRGEQGADRVARALEQPGCISAVSFTTLLVVLAGTPPRIVAEDIARLNLEIALVDSGCAVDAARLIHSGVKLEIAFTVALSRARGLEVMLGERGVTVPPEWKITPMFLR